MWTTINGKFTTFKRLNLKIDKSIIEINKRIKYLWYSLEEQQVIIKQNTHLLLSKYEVDTLEDFEKLYKPSFYNKLDKYLSKVDQEEKRLYKNKFEYLKQYIYNKSIQ